MAGSKDIILDQLIKVSPISIELIDAHEQKLICANGWTSRHLGYSETEFLKLSKNMFEAIVHPDDRETQLNAYNSFFHDHETLYREFTIRVKRKDGNYDHLQLRICVLEWGKDDKPHKYLCTVMDVSEAIILKNQISDQVKKLDQISFKNNHELRAPVATILGLINLIDHEDFSNTHIREIINSLKATVVKLDDIIKEINEATYP